MRNVSYSFVAIIASLAFAFVACSSNSDTEDHDAFATYQACWTEHTTTEGFTAAMAVTICCLSHPIGTQPMGVVCGSNATTCETYVGSNSTSIGSADITSGCTDYVTQKGM
jgi:hypothetical protein